MIHDQELMREFDEAEELIRNIRSKVVKLYDRQRGAIIGLSHCKDFEEYKDKLANYKDASEQWDYFRGRMDTLSNKCDTR